MRNKTTPAATAAPASPFLNGPHSSVAETTSVFELEVMFPWAKQWQQTVALTDQAPFRSEQAARDWWTSVASSSDMYRTAQVRVVEVVRRVLPNVVEPVEGWEAYRRGVALIEADRATSVTTS